MWITRIGKTTVVCELSEKLSSQGTIVRWANANEFSDLYDICNQWQLLDPLPRDDTALQDLILQITENQTLVVDDVHLIPQRHISRLRSYQKN